MTLERGCDMVCKDCKYYNSEITNTDLKISELRGRGYCTSIEYPVHKEADGCCRYEQKETQYDTVIP